MTSRLTRQVLCAALGTAAFAVAAQTATPPAAGAPTNVGVSQGTANEAAGKAVPRADTGTLVRTSPDAATKARAGVADTAAAAGSPNVSQAGAMSGSTNTNATPTPRQRPRKADRN